MNAVISTGLPLRFAVDMELKEAKWSHAFVEFTDLLATEGESAFKVPLELINLNSDIDAVIKKSRKQVKNLTD